MNRLGRRTAASDDRKSLRSVRIGMKQEQRKIMGDAGISVIITDLDREHCFCVQVGQLSLYLHATELSELILMLHQACLRWYVKRTANMQWDESKIFTGDNIRISGPDYTGGFTLLVRDTSIRLNQGQLLYMLTEAQRAILLWHLQSTKLTYGVKDTLTIVDGPALAWFQAAAINADMTRLSTTVEGN